MLAFKLELSAFLYRAYRLGQRAPPQRSLLGLWHSETSDLGVSCKEEGEEEGPPATPERQAL